jgi:sulfotransferase family protein
MDPHTAAALFWYARNDLYFRLGLDVRDDVLLIAYQDMVEDPETAARRVCAFLELPYRPEFAADVAAGPARDRLAIDPLVRSLCDDLTARFEKVAGNG